MYTGQIPKIWYGLHCQASLVYATIQPVFHLSTTGIAQELLKRNHKIGMAIEKEQSQNLKIRLFRGISFLKAGKE